MNSNANSNSPLATNLEGNFESTYTLSPIGECVPWFAVWAERLSQTLCSESSLGYRRSGVTLLLLLVSFGAILIVVGAAPVAGPWDMVALLDGGWRILNGQVPHTDFHNPIGPLTYLLVAFGMEIAAPSTSALAYGSILLLAFVSPMAWHISCKRLPWVVAFVFTLFMSLILVTPRPLGYEIRETTYAMIYNRQGYVLLSLLLLCVFLKPRDLAIQTPMLDGMLNGILLALLFYCKITYFLIAAGMILFAAILEYHQWRWFLVSALAFVGACGAFFLVFHINMYSYLSDIGVAGQSQSFAMRLKLMSEGLRTNATWIYMLIVCLCLWTWAAARPGKPQFSIFAWLAAGSILASAELISSGNANQGGGRDDPLYFVAAVVSLELFRRWNRNEATRRGTAARFTHTTSIVLLLPIFCGTILVRDLASCTYAAAWNIEKSSRLEASQRLNSVRLTDFLVPPSTDHITAYWPARDHPAKINDGIALLQKYMQKGDRVMAVAFANPFSFALGLTPARDYSLWWDLGFSFDQRHLPSAREFLGDASIVMIPRLADRTQGCCFETVDLLLGHYGEYLRANFHEQASSDTWVLLRRNSS
jgi:hypothetical protein